MLSDIVKTAICSFDKAEFTHLAACPFCGGPVQGYDTREKKYATIREGDSTRVITVRIKRFTCRRCNRLSNADEPFYPGTRLGSLVVDLYFCLASTISGSRAARVIDAIGIDVDRTTWRNYAARPVPAIEAADIFGMRIPRSIIAVSTLAAGVAEGGSVRGPEALAASNYPSTFNDGGANLPKAAGKKSSAASSGAGDYAVARSCSSGTSRPYEPELAAAAGGTARSPAL